MDGLGSRTDGTVVLVRSDNGGRGFYLSLFAFFRGAIAKELVLCPNLSRLWRSMRGHPPPPSLISSDSSSPTQRLTHCMSTRCLRSAVSRRCRRASCHLPLLRPLVINAAPMKAVVASEHKVHRCPPSAQLLVISLAVVLPTNHLSPVTPPSSTTCHQPPTPKFGRGGSSGKNHSSSGTAVAPSATGSTAYNTSARAINRRRTRRWAGTLCSQLQ